MDDPLHASHWQQLAAAGEAVAVTAVIALSLFVLFERLSRAPLPERSAALAPCERTLATAVRDACVRAVTGAAQAAAPALVSPDAAVPAPGVAVR